MDHNLDLNFNQCIKSVLYFGHTTYQNICSGEIANVPWGLDDWMLAAVTIGILAFILGVLTKKVVDEIRNKDS